MRDTFRCFSCTPGVSVVVDVEVVMMMLKPIRFSVAETSKGPTKSPGKCGNAPHCN